MTIPKLFIFFTLFLFGVIGTIALFKEKTPESPIAPIEIAIENEIRPVETRIPIPVVQQNRAQPTIDETDAPKKENAAGPDNRSESDLPDANRIDELFNIHEPKLPIVETIVYTSSVPWLKGRPAWLSDYASHYKTSRHFIARSLHGKPDYYNQNLCKGDRFNVLSGNKKFEFYILVDASRCKAWFYYIDLDSNDAVLLKTYRVAIGRHEPSKTSGFLTPFGKYKLGDRIIAYKPKMMGIYQGKKTEMITVFGTRWIPFSQEIGTCSAPAKGFGIHGTPWAPDKDGVLVDNTSGIGKYESDGCIRFTTPDIEEIYAIVATKPTVIEIVPDFYKSSLFTQSTDSEKKEG